MPDRDLSQVSPDELRERLRQITESGPPWSRQTHLRDGVLVSGFDGWDNLGLRQQLGMLPENGEN